MATELHWYTRSNGNLIGLVLRDHARQAYEFLVFGSVDGHYLLVHEKAGIGEHHAACSQVAAALETDLVIVNCAA